MTEARLSRLEIQIMETLWERGEASIRDMREAFPEKKRPGYTTVQTMVYRMEAKKVVRRVRKLGGQGCWWLHGKGWRPWVFRGSQ